MPYRRQHAANLYDELGAVVYRCCIRILHDREAAHDATQEVFLRLLGSPATFEGREKVFAWAVHVARNHCINLRRDSRHDAHLSFAPERDQGMKPDLAGALLARALLERFDVATQRAVLGVLASGMSYKEAAAALSLSPGIVARKVRRFLEDTRAYLTTSEHEEARSLFDADAPSLPSRPPLSNPRGERGAKRAAVAAAGRAAGAAERAGLVGVSKTAA